MASPRASSIELIAGMDVGPIFLCSRPEGCRECPHIRRLFRHSSLEFIPWLDCRGSLFLRSFSGPVEPHGRLLTCGWGLFRTVSVFTIPRYSVVDIGGRTMVMNIQPRCSLTAGEISVKVPRFSERFQWSGHRSGKDPATGAGGLESPSTWHLRNLL